MNWQAHFADPIPVDGKQFVTLKDAADYIDAMKNPDLQWAQAGECLLIAARNGGHVVLVQIARIAVMKALHREKVERVRKETWRERRKAARRG